MWETLKLTPSPFTFILHNSPTIFMPLKYFCLLWDTYLAKNDVLKIACILLLRYWWKLRWGFLQFLDIQLHLLHVNLHVMNSCIKIEVLCMKWDIQETYQETYQDIQKVWRWHYCIKFWRHIQCSAFCLI